MDHINVPSKTSIHGVNEGSKMFLSLLEADFSALQRKSFFDILEHWIETSLLFPEGHVKYVFGLCPQLLHSSESIIIKICQKIVLEWYARILVPCKLLVRIGKYWVFRPFLKVLGLWFQPFWAASIWRFFSHFNFSLWSAIFVMIYWPVFVQIRLELKSDPFVPRPVCSQLDPGEKLPPKKTSLMLLTKSSRPMPSSQLRPSIWHTIKNN